MVPTTASSQAVTLAGNQNADTLDFGFAELAKIEGHVFFDANSSGGFDGGEIGLAGVTVTITNINTNVVVATKVTAPCPGATCGEYTFLVPAGNYPITYDPAPVSVTYPLETTLTPINLTVISGVEYTGNDFGRTYAGRIDLVWNDATNLGVRDAGEPGIRV